MMAVDQLVEQIDHKLQSWWFDPGFTLLNVKVLFFCFIFYNRRIQEKGNDIELGLEQWMLLLCSACKIIIVILIS